MADLSAGNRKQRHEGWLTRPGSIGRRLYCRQPPCRSAGVLFVPHHTPALCRALKDKRWVYGIEVLRHSTAATKLAPPLNRQGYTSSAI